MGPDHLKPRPQVSDQRVVNHTAVAELFWSLVLTELDNKDSLYSGVTMALFTGTSLAHCVIQHQA